MKKILCLVFLLISVASWSQNTEFRSTWVITWNYISASSTVEENKARIIQILENHKRANMNAVIWQVRQSGSAYYQSSYEPWGQYAGDAYPGFDPLAFVIEEAHKRGLEVHAWFNTFMISSNEAGKVTAKHPNWICTSGSGTPMSQHFALSPGIDSVRKYTLNVAMEIVNNYDIDGIHLDYIRWNEYDVSDMGSKSAEEFPMDGMISEERLNRLKSSTMDETSRFIFDKYHPYSAGVPAGYSTWGDWRRAGVTEFVKMLHDSIQLVKPHVRLSAAALGKYKAGGDSGWNGYYVVFQDAALWFNMGYLDQLTPMHYHWYTGATMVNELESDWEPYIAQGISDKRMYTVGPASYILEENKTWDNHSDIISGCRTKSWVDGFQFFSYGSWRDRDYWTEAGSSFFNVKTRMRPIQSKTPPLQPSMAITKVDSLHYTLTVTPNAPENCWYIVYRSLDATLDTDDDMIIYTTFGNKEFSTNVEFSGLQTYTGKYYYFTAAYNRYWNESPLSNPVLTDNIPSLAPVVSVTNPSENGSIAVNGTVSFTFSKAMNTSTFQGAFQITPSATTAFGWSSVGNYVLISFPNKLSYNTEYTITLGSTLKDLNGKALDGNADGIPGDAYTYHFRTELQDSRGPAITSSTVADQSSGVDIGSVFSLTFDEAILQSSVTASNVTIKNSTNTSVPYSYTLYTTEDSRSVLSIQPNALLKDSENYTLNIGGTITDMLGNAMGNDVIYHFKTSSYYYSTEKVIDEFSDITGWKDPSFSGSTTGLNKSGSSFLINTQYGLPALSLKHSGTLTYSWIIPSTSYLIREYLDPQAAPGLVTFDTTYVMQVYVLGDSSNVKFRFCIDEYSNSAWGDHEVSQWQKVNWNGWKLVEWKLSDPSSVGSWLSTNNALTGTSFRTDSYQFTRDDNSDASGVLYFDKYRVVKKVRRTTGITEMTKTGISVLNCYPNPSAGTATLSINIPRDDKYTVTVYDITGRIVERLLQERYSEGVYFVTFGERYSPGVYLVELRSSSEKQSIRFIKR